MRVRGAREARLFWIITIGGAAFALAAFGASSLGDRLDHRSGHLIAIVAELSAIVAATAGTRPTVITAFNIIIAMLIGFAVPAAASRCSPWIVALGALPIGVCGVLADDPPVFGPACGLAAAAIAIAVSTTSLRAPILRTVAGALAVQAAFRLPWPNPVGSTALVGIVSLAPILIVGWWRAHRRERRIASLVAGVLGLGFVVGAASALLVGLRTQSDARDAIDATQRALDAFASGDQSVATDELQHAEQLMSSVNGELHSWWASGALTVPVVSQHVDLARDLTDEATMALSAVLDANRRAAGPDLQLTDGTLDVDAIGGLVDPLERAALALDSLSATVDDGTSDAWTIDPLKRKLFSVRADLARARSGTSTALDVLRQAPDLLGASGERRYLLTLLTPAELRGSIGLLGSYGEVSAVGGTLDLVKVGRNADLNEGGVGDNRQLHAPDDFVARYATFNPTTLWQNLPTSPDWPTNAAIMADLFPQSGGEKVDGVVAMDPDALVAFLRITGPITTAGWPVPVSADNARQILLIDQYATFTDKTDRVNFLGEVAEQMWAKLKQISPDPAEVLDTLGPVAAQGHIMLWSANPDEQNMFRRVGVSGQIAPLVGDDAFAITSNNTGGDKLDAYLDRSTDYSVRWDPQRGTLDATATVELTNNAPANLPPYATGFATEDIGQNRDWVTVYTPLSFRSATVDGQPVGPDLKPELGRNTVSQHVRIDRGQTVTFTTELSGGVTGDQYRIAVTRQVTARPEPFTITVSVPAGWRLSSPSSGATVSANGTTVSITLGPERDHLVVFDAS